MIRVHVTNWLSTRNRIHRSVFHPAGMELHTPAGGLFFLHIGRHNPTQELVLRIDDPIKVAMELLLEVPYKTLVRKMGAIDAAHVARLARRAVGDPVPTDAGVSHAPPPTPAPVTPPTETARGNPPDPRKTRHKTGNRPRGPTPRKTGDKRS